MISGPTTSVLTLLFEMAGNLDQLRACIDDGFDLDNLTDWETPLHVAVQLNNLQAAAMLLECGATPLQQVEHSDGSFTALSLASRLGYVRWFV